MEKRGLAVAGLLVMTYLIIDLTVPGHSIHAKISRHFAFEKRQHGGSAPAPFLAAGLPAFAALGGGLAITNLLRRFRKRTKP